jgi:hypothetical protein
MKIGFPFGRRVEAAAIDHQPIDPSAAGRALAEMACLSARERVRERTRLMCRDMGIPVPPVLVRKDGSAGE